MPGNHCNPSPLREWSLGSSTWPVRFMPTKVINKQSAIGTENGLTQTKLKTSPQVWCPDDSEKLLQRSTVFSTALFLIRNKSEKQFKKKKSAWAQQVSRASASGKEGLSSKEGQGGRHFIFIFIFKHRHSLLLVNVPFSLVIKAFDRPQASCFT